MFEDNSIIFRKGQVDKLYALEHWFNFIPHPAQKQIIQGMKKNTYIAAGRRFGKSKLMAADINYRALTTPDYIQYVFAPTRPQSEIIYNECKTMLLKSPIASQFITKMKDFPFPEIRFKSGSVIYARTMGKGEEGTNIRGYAAHRIIIDEAAFVKEELINTAIRPMLADFDGDLTAISTPLGRNHFYEDYMKGMQHDEGYAAFHFTSFDNPHISHDYIKREQLRITDLQFRTEYLAEFVDDAVCVFPWKDIDASRCDFGEENDPKETKQYYIGVDVAKSTDYTAIVVMDGTTPQKVRVVYTEVFQNQAYAYILDRLLALAGQYHAVKILIDETGVGAGITEQVMLRLPIAEGFNFSMEKKIGLINTLKVGLQQRRIELSQYNERLLNELHYYQYELTDAGNIRMNAPSGKHDDMVIALALAYIKISVPYGDADVTLIPQVIDLNRSKASLDSYRDAAMPFDTGDYGVTVI